MTSHSARTPAWEQSKENAAPLQRGRNVAALEDALVETDETRVFKEKSVERYERLVQQSEKEDYKPKTNDDPLVDWLGYIKFHQDHFPTNTHDQFLLMERCFRALCRFRQYANDVRFIRLCCRYAEKTERANEIFKYLYQQKIGTETAIFYIGWGFIAEKEENFTFAKSIYEKGLRKKAKPVKQLKERQKQFNRRMARHWLNATQQDDDDEGAPNRGVLGSLSEDSFQRNDRSTTRPPGPFFLSRASAAPTGENSQNSFVDRSVPSRSAAGNNTSTGPAFSIFVEDGGATAPADPLDEPKENVRYRKLERDQDRTKENTHAAERWNERGAYEPSYAKVRAAPKPRSAIPPPFPVYVDEECVAKQRKEEEKREQLSDFHRRVRDDRTFRERDDLIRVGETLLKDPLRYVKNPEQLEADQRTAKAPATEESTTTAVRTKRTGNYGFSNRLLKNRDTGEEQCFAEARALAKYYKLVDASTNINNLMKTAESSDNMWTGENSSGDDDASKADDSSNSPPQKQRPLGQRRKSMMIQRNGSTGIASPVNASTASSTLEDEGANVGHAEPTFHSRIAAQDISLMFCSPVGVKLNDSVSEALNRSVGLGTILNQSGISEPVEERSMAAIEEETGFQIFDDESDQNAKTGVFDILVEPANDHPAQPKHSGFVIYNEEEEKEEEEEEEGKEPAKSPIRRAAFAILDDEEEGSGEHFDQRNQPQAIERADQPESGGFSIFADDTDANNDALAKKGQASGDSPPEEKSTGLDVKEEMFANSKGHASREPNPHEKSSGFSIYADDADVNEEEFSNNKGEAVSLAVEKHLDNVQKKKSTGFSIYTEHTDVKKEIIGEKASDLASTKEDNSDSQNKALKVEIHQESSDEDATCFSFFQDKNFEAGGDGEETASFTSFQDVFGDLPTTNKRQSDYSYVNSGRKKRRKSSIFANDVGNDLVENIGDISAIMPAEDTVTVGCDFVANHQKAVDYVDQQKKESRDAIRRLASRAVSFPVDRESLEKILITENLVTNLPCDCLPSNLRINRKEIAPGTKFVLRRKTAAVKQELGRGAYGCVLLLESDEHISAGKAAVKAQSPVGPLAWEFEVLERLRDRLKGKLDPLKQSPFPRPLSFVSLADGAFLTMQAVSESGFTFVDLVNFHRQVRGKQSLPEILALHYACRMLYVLETLHWFGRILHCDTKADNWVLSSSDLIGGEPIAASDVMLTDFGRAIDLEDLDTGNDNPLDNQLKGKASRDDMLCVAMRKDLPWSFDIDTYGLCDTAHILLHGTSLELVCDAKTERWGPKQKCYRYHQVGLWTNLFDTLLNLEDPDQAAVGSRPGSLRKVRAEFEQYLEENKDKVKAALKEQARDLPKKRATMSR